MISAKAVRIKKAGWDMPSYFECGKTEFANYLESSAAYDVRQRMGRLYWAYYGDKVVGYMMLATDRLDRTLQNRLGIDSYGHIPALSISLLAVDKRYEGRGIGRLMVHHALFTAGELAATVGCRAVLANSEPDVVGFYKKLGFTEIGRDGDYVLTYFDIGTEPLEWNGPMSAT